MQLGNFANHWFGPKTTNTSTKIQRIEGGETTTMMFCALFPNFVVKTIKNLSILLFMYRDTFRSVQCPWSLIKPMHWSEALGLVIVVLLMHCWSLTDRHCIMKNGQTPQTKDANFITDEKYVSFRVICCRVDIMKNLLHNSFLHGCVGGIAFYAYITAFHQCPHINFLL